MNEDELAVSENSEEPQTDNQPETLLNPKTEAPSNEELEAMPHTTEEEEDEEDVDWGERPEWIPQQFWDDKDGPDVEAVFKSYNELRSKMSAGLHKAPKDGAYDTKILSDAGVGDEDEMLSGFVDVAKNHGISQDAFNEMASLYLDAVGGAEEQAQTSIKEEKAKLGRNADRIIETTDKWLTKLGSSGVLNESEVNALANASNNAYFITALNKIRESYNEAPIPAIDIQEGAKMTQTDLASMIADPRYGKDMAYTNKVQQDWFEASGEM